MNPISDGVGNMNPVPDGGVTTRIPDVLYMLHKII
jgi:hypothetical protein